MRIVFLLLALAASGTQAEIYKWVDAAGNVTYSDKPPAGAVRQAQAVREQLSVIGGDPYIATAAAAMRERAAQRAEHEEKDWQRRREAMLVQQQAAPMPVGEELDFYPGYVVPTHFKRNAYGGQVHYRMPAQRSQGSSRSSSLR